MKKSKTQQLHMWDIEVAECFSAWRGELVARYFEALRYRQQLTPGEFFLYSTRDIQKNSGLTYKQQLYAKKILAGSDWINIRTKSFGKGTKIEFQVTELAKECTKFIRHKHDPNVVRKRLSRTFKTRFSTGFSTTTEFPKRKLAN